MTFWLVLLASLLGIGALVAAAEWLHASRRLTADATRRLVHVGVGLWAAASPLLFDRPEPLYLVAGAAVVVNAVAVRRGWLGGMHAVERPSVGTATLPAAYLLALFVAWTMDPGRKYELQVAFLILAVSDPLASLVGTWKRPRGGAPPNARAKSTAGTIAFVLSAWILALGALLAFRAAGVVSGSGMDLLALSLVVAVVSGAAERMGRRGWDNLWIVVAVLVVLVTYAEHPEARAWLYASAPAGSLFAAAAYRMRFLDASGAVAGGFFGASLVAFGGWAWIAPAFTFFLLSSLLSKIGAARKAADQRRHAKGHVRDAGQVLANGGIGWMLLLVYAVAPGDSWYWGFVGAFAAAAADTWGTEIGMLSRGRPRLLLTGRPVPRGTSGAVSVAGTLGGIASAGSIGVAAWLAGGPQFDAAGAGPALAVVVLAGFLASCVDSVLGMTLQARYRDALTGEPTERSDTAGLANELVAGRRWADNDRVNLMATLVGAAVAMACFHALDFAS